MVTAIGVLALQGGFAAHFAMLRRLGVQACEVRRASELDALDGLILPGGESTALLRLMAGEAWFDALRAMHARGGALLGTCAGSILLVRRVHGPAQASAALLDAEITRNAYGRQAESFQAALAAPWFGAPLPGIFIRAPRFTAVDAQAVVLAHHDGEPVLVRQGQVLASTFHPELTPDSRVHRLFLEMAAPACVSAWQRSQRGRAARDA